MPGRAAAARVAQCGGRGREDELGRGRRGQPAGGRRVGQREERGIAGAGRGNRMQLRGGERRRGRAKCWRGEGARRAARTGGARGAEGGAWESGAWEGGACGRTRRAPSQGGRPRQGGALPAWPFTESSLAPPFWRARPAPPAAPPQTPARWQARRAGRQGRLAGQPGSGRRAKPPASPSTRLQRSPSNLAPGGHQRVPLLTLKALPPPSSNSRMAATLPQLQRAGRSGAQQAAGGREVSAGPARRGHSGSSGGGGGRAKSRGAGTGSREGAAA